MTDSQDEDAARYLLVLDIRWTGKVLGANPVRVFMSGDLSSGGSKGGARDAPPGGPNSFNFMQFLEKFGKITCWRPPGELAPPPQGKPGSATAQG